MVEPGEIAIVHVTGRLVDGRGNEAPASQTDANASVDGPDAGEVFETTDVDVALEEGIYHGQRDFKPLEFRVGEGHVVPGLDEAVQGMSEGEEQTVVLDPEDAYGTVDERAIVTVPIAEIEARSDTTAAVGELVESERGELGWITAVDETDVTVDFNHELAGHTVEFEIRLLETHGSTTNREANA
ncbi:MAG: FKBP-type peptidyl-prolyl cis-trans isomerase [Halolamina sp.]